MSVAQLKRSNAKSPENPWLYLQVGDPEANRLRLRRQHKPHAEKQFGRHPLVPHRSTEFQAEAVSKASCPGYAQICAHLQSHPKYKDLAVVHLQTCKLHNTEPSSHLIKDKAPRTAPSKVLVILLINEKKLQKPGLQSHRRLR